jgi:hypothetical protein
VLQKGFGFDKQNREDREKSDISSTKCPNISIYAIIGWWLQRCLVPRKWDGDGD